MRQPLAVMAAPAVQAPGRSALRTLGDLWCRTMHNDVTWPVQGHYHCKRCWRTYAVPFLEEPVRRQAAAPPVAQPVSSVTRAVSSATQAAA
jgi:hypothetical protein